MQTKEIPHPPIVTQEEWLAKRRELLAHEKEATMVRDRVSAERRRLPMVKIEKQYSFGGPKGTTSLLDIFEGRRQLIVYHFMFDPDWEDGCPSCTGYVDALGDISGLAEKDTTMALISRAPLPKLEKYKAKRGWTLPWYSSFESDFNYDFHVTFDEKVAPLDYNFMGPKDFAEKFGHDMHGEGHALSVFFNWNNEVFHTYTAYARGVEGVTDEYYLLDMTPYGRQQDWEDSPSDWPQKPTYG